jgi:hypothetical protein
MKSVSPKRMMLAAAVIAGDDGQFPQFMDDPAADGDVGGRAAFHGSLRIRIRRWHKVPGPVPYRSAQGLGQLGYALTGVRSIQRKSPNGNWLVVWCSCLIEIAASWRNEDQTIGTQATEIHWQGRITAAAGRSAVAGRAAASALPGSIRNRRIATPHLDHGSDRSGDGRRSWPALLHARRASGDGTSCRDLCR